MWNFRKRVRKKNQKKNKRPSTSASLSVWLKCNSEWKKKNEEISDTCDSSLLCRFGVWDESCQEEYRWKHFGSSYYSCHLEQYRKKCVKIIYTNTSRKVEPISKLILEIFIILQNVSWRESIEKNLPTKQSNIHIRSNIWPV